MQKRVTSSRSDLLFVYRKLTCLSLMSIVLLRQMHLVDVLPYCVERIRIKHLYRFCESLQLFTLHFSLEGYPSLITIQPFKELSSSLSLIYISSKLSPPIFTSLPRYRCRCISATFSRSRAGLYFCGLRFTS